MATSAPQRAESVSFLSAARRAEPGNPDREFGRSTSAQMKKETT